MKISVGGMIASGKSTLVKQLAEHYNLATMEEFRQDDQVFNSLLQWLYEGKEHVEMLLQVYFLHKHWEAQREVPNNVVIDRHIIEHWLFAQINLKSKPQVLNMYNGLFHQYMNDIIHPDVYVILEVGWDDFKKRIMKRGRSQEVDNFKSNEPYFKELLANYTKKLIAQCNVYDIKYVVVDTNGKTTEQVLKETIKKIDEVTK